MKNLLNKLLLIMMVVNLSSCTVDDDSLDGDIASLYVGNWTNNYDIAKTKDVGGLTTIERINDNEIRMINFFNLDKETIFRVEGNDLYINSTEVGGFIVSGEGTSNYSYDEITIYYTFDGDEYVALLTSLN